MRPLELTRYVMQRLISVLICVAMLYHLVAWMGFMWRNPKANQMSCYKHPLAIWRWEKLPQYCEEITK
jgi:hypothetical protein